MINFSEALKELKKGKRLVRKGWNGKGIFIELQKPDKNSKMNKPYIYIDTTNLKSDYPNVIRGKVPWTASQTDLLASDWSVLDE